MAGAAGAAAAGGAEAGGRACDGAPGSLAHGGATATQEGLAEVSDVEVGMVIDDNAEMGVLGSAAEGALVGTRHSYTPATDAMTAEGARCRSGPWYI